MTKDPGNACGKCDNGVVQLKYIKYFYVVINVGERVFERFPLTICLIWKSL